MIERIDDKRFEEVVGLSVQDAIRYPRRRQGIYKVAMCMIVGFMYEHLHMTGTHISEVLQTDDRHTYDMLRHHQNYMEIDLIYRRKYRLAFSEKHK
jgi:hypothetical protein